MRVVFHSNLDLNYCHRIQENWPKMDGHVPQIGSRIENAGHHKYILSLKVVGVTYKRVKNINGSPETVAEVELHIGTTQTLSEWIKWYDKTFN